MVDGVLDRYNAEAVPLLRERFGYSNDMAIPKIAKVSVNVSVSAAVANPKILDAVKSDFALVVGQCPAMTCAKKSISTFKLREGMPLGFKVTLRRQRMYSFLDRVLYGALPRSRDFRGVGKKQFDGRGNLAFGIKDHTIFFEIEYDKVSVNFGMDINLVTTAGTDEEAMCLLEAVGFPFKG